MKHFLYQVEFIQEASDRILHYVLLVLPVMCMCVIGAWGGGVGGRLFMSFVVVVSFFHFIFFVFYIQGALLSEPSRFYI